MANVTLGKTTGDTDKERLRKAGSTSLLMQDWLKRFNQTTYRPITPYSQSQSLNGLSDEVLNDGFDLGESKLDSSPAALRPDRFTKNLDYRPFYEPTNGFSNASQVHSESRNTTLAEAAGIVSQTFSEAWGPALKAGEKVVLYGAKKARKVAAQAAQQATRELLNQLKGAPATKETQSDKSKPTKTESTLLEGKAAVQEAQQIILKAPATLLGIEGQPKPKTEQEQIKQQQQTIENNKKKQVLEAKVKQFAYDRKERYLSQEIAPIRAELGNDALNQSNTSVKEDLSLASVGRARMIFEDRERKKHRGQNTESKKSPKQLAHITDLEGSASGKTGQESLALTQHAG